MKIWKPWKNFPLDSINISDQGKMTITVYYLFGMISVHRSKFLSSCITLQTFAFAEIGSSKQQDRLNEIQEWVAPMRKFNSFDEDCIPELVSQLKSYNEDALDMPKGLAITLRIMKYLAVPPKVDYKVEGQYLLLIKEMFENIIINFYTILRPFFFSSLWLYFAEQTEELKYKYNLIELYSNDCFSMWINIYK